MFKDKLVQLRAATTAKFKHAQHVTNALVAHLREFTPEEYPKPLDPRKLKTDKDLHDIVETLYNEEKISITDYISVDSGSPTQFVVTAVAKVLRGEELPKTTRRGAGTGYSTKSLVPPSEAEVQAVMTALSNLTPRRKVHSTKSGENLLALQEMKRTGKYTFAGPVNQQLLAEKRYADALELLNIERRNLIARSLVTFFEKLYPKSKY